MYEILAGIKYFELFNRSVACMKMKIELFNRSVACMKMKIFFSSILDSARQ
jgi:hypothetical protein